MLRAQMTLNLELSIAESVIRTLWMISPHGYGQSKNKTFTVSTKNLIVRNVHSSIFLSCSRRILWFVCCNQPIRFDLWSFIFYWPLPFVWECLTHCGETCSMTSIHLEWRYLLQRQNYAHERFKKIVIPVQNDDCLFPSKTVNPIKIA